MMQTVLINGHGWSGSSAFIDFLDQSNSDQYFLVPGEFDDFRVPGTLRELLESNKTPVSHRRRNLSSRLKFKVRSLISDKSWRYIFPHSKVSKTSAKKELVVQRIEHEVFQTCIKRSQKKDLEPIDNLIIWYNELRAAYEKIAPGASTLIFEQILLFDDDPKIYKWLDFDKLILFIRQPEKQLSATLESKVLYSNYPWQAEFLTGSVGQNNTRKYQIFLDTTIVRYKWILRFLETHEPSKILIVDFDSFLYNYYDTVQKMMVFAGIDLRGNVRTFQIEESRRRDNPWPNEYLKLENIDVANDEYAQFKVQLSTKYWVI